ncbi:TAXI family TRAP transporter solute-binding subunit [Bacillus pinisoli]|uniref:TAXI family TRAP transporter solute-binding subunit n=1 Tax=Bacillus pinisoli TaxID=2901866 RepID=UPI001FF59025|nr:TAXI family TRAP transporter solute-binding subunit [Bacillus pinisoli]
MKKKSLFIGFILMLGLSMILSACGGKQLVSIVTGGTGGTYYPLGGAMADIVNENTDIEATAQSSGASQENMQSLADNKADIAFVQTDIASYANEGTLMFEGNAITNVQAIGTLYPETVQIVTLADSGINSVEDLAGKTVSVGAPGSGTYANAEQILEAHGMTFDDIDAQNLAFDESTEGIQDGNIDAAFITSGTPTGSVEALSAIKGVKLIPIEQDKIDALIQKYPFYAKDVVPSGTYGMETETTTVAVLAMLVARAELDEDTVYEITKAIFENTDKITHAKGKLITAESALDGLGIELHPGADKYFTEKGLK